jgi:hypothetical protein
MEIGGVYFCKLFYLFIREKLNVTGTGLDHVGIY